MDVERDIGLLEDFWHFPGRYIAVQENGVVTLLHVNEQMALLDAAAGDDVPNPLVWPFTPDGRSIIDGEPVPWLVPDGDAWMVEVANRVWHMEGRRGEVQGVSDRGEHLRARYENLPWQGLMMEVQVDQRDVLQIKPTGSVGARPGPVYFDFESVVAVTASVGLVDNQTEASSEVRFMLPEGARFQLWYEAACRQEDALLHDIVAGRGGTGFVLADDRQKLADVPRSTCMAGQSMGGGGGHACPEIRAFDGDLMAWADVSPSSGIRYDVRVLVAAWMVTAFTVDERGHVVPWDAADPLAC